MAQWRPRDSLGATTILRLSWSLKMRIFHFTKLKRSCRALQSIPVYGSAVQHSTVQCSAVQCSTVHCTECSARPSSARRTAAVLTAQAWRERLCDCREVRSGSSYTGGRRHPLMTDRGSMVRQGEGRPRAHCGRGAAPGQPMDSLRVAGATLEIPKGGPNGSKSDLGEPQRLPGRAPGQPRVS